MITILALTLGLLLGSAYVLVAQVYTPRHAAAHMPVVHVESDPPTDLLGLHADTVTVTATDATFRELEIGHLDLTLHDVAVVDRTADAVDGTLSDVNVTLSDGSAITLDEIRIAGAADAIRATTTIDGAQAETLIADAVEQRTGVRPSSVRLTPPDTLTIDAGVTVTGTLSVSDEGDLVVRLTDDPAGIGELVLLRGSKDLPIRLTDVQVTKAGNLRLVGDLSIGLLG